MGWNRLEASPGCRLLTSGSYYFANSYRVVEPPAGWHAAVGEYGGPFVGAIERGRVLACQFHPELSGPLGAGVLRRWAELVEAQAC
jgi:imidazoleglycerol phosphate synthase glutamine amidotransferase subunit HisH